MAELTTRERLQPSLLDRLTDEEPGSRVEPRERRELSMRDLRRAVLRDLSWLFNASGIGEVQDLSQFPAAAASVVNFGLPDLTGRCASGLDVQEVEHRMRRAIREFEPRVLRDTVEVRAVAPSQDASAQPGTGNRLVFEVTGQLWGQPLPERLYLRTELDLECGEIRITGAGA